MIDDRAEAREAIREVTRRAGYEVTAVADGREGLRQLFQSTVDLVLLDLVMPDMTGWDLISAIRDITEVPIIVVSGRDTELDRVRVLNAGANDFLAKPFGNQELLARIAARLRDRRAHVEQLEQVYEDRCIRIDFSLREVRVRGSEVLLTRLEFKLLVALVLSRSRTLGHDDLLRSVWGESEGSSTTHVKTYIGYLRRKLDGVEPGLGTRLILTVRGFGYRFQPCASADSPAD
ncbi:response regulator transcription factor [Miltoncostaea oceani]|uniref:response regulator transcription factor n=1 Tax=Miltoncostaea oceani TaxID=2843216 RepID=UPI001C3D6AFC|nr:response regulator transcription factor [Miltoncostaea oceani]